MAPLSGLILGSGIASKRSSVRLPIAKRNLEAEHGPYCSTAESRPLARYFWQLRRFPMLEPQEEYTLAQSWCEYGDRNAAHRLVTSHLRLVIKIAKGYRGYGLPISDVISEGNVGLMQALERFEPEKGFRLATYAGWRILGQQSRNTSCAPGRW